MEKINDDNDNNNNVIILRDYLHTLFDANARGICYWRVHRHHKCYKCKQYGHIAIDCEKVCGKCQNVHNNSICVFSIENLYRKILRVLKENTIPDPIKLTKKLEEEKIKIQLENTRSSLKFKYDNLSISKQIQYEKIKEEVILKPSALEIVQCSGKPKRYKCVKQDICLNQQECVRKDPQKIKVQLITPKVNMSKLDYKDKCKEYMNLIFEADRRPPEKSLSFFDADKSRLTMRFKTYKLKRPRGHRGQVTIRDNQVIVVGSANDKKLEEIHYLSDLLRKHRKFISDYQEIKKLNNSAKQLKDRINLMDQEIKEKEEAIVDIQNNKNDIINNYKKVAESHVARREYALNQKWNRFRRNKELHYNRFNQKKEKFYERKEKYFEKKDALYNKFKINKEEYKEKVKNNLMRHFDYIPKPKVETKEEWAKNFKQLNNHCLGHLEQSYGKNYIEYFWDKHKSALGLTKESNTKQMRNKPNCQ